MNNQPTGFFAYSSKQKFVADTIESSIEKLNETGIIKVKGWKDLKINGKPVIRQICKAIDDCDIFFCDLSDLNKNVLFELGYAISKEKRIYITINKTCLEATNNYKSYSILSTIGYSLYENSKQFLDNFIKEAPYKQQEINQSLIDVGEYLLRDKAKFKKIFYLKSARPIEASIKLTSRLNSSRIQIIADDPNEISNQTLYWYFENTITAYGLVIHLIDQDQDMADRSFQNEKYSLVAGMAFGFDIPLMIIAGEPFESPFDYQDLIKVYTSPTDSVYKLNGWLEKLEKQFVDEQEKFTEQKTDNKSAVELRNIHIGDPFAENEEEYLQEYFVETAAFQEALTVLRTRVFVGRKGTGKTANLFQIRNSINSDKRNHVCLIIPQDYELRGIIRLIESVKNRLDPGYLLISLWKFLIYTELAKSIYEKYLHKHKNVPLQNEEEKFCHFIENEGDYFQMDFAERLEYATQELCTLNNNIGLREHNEKISEILHSRVIGFLREHLETALAEKYKVYILVDNLDKAWEKNEHLRTFSDFLFGLFSAANAVTNELQKEGGKWKHVNLSFIIFLREDIFTYISEDHARESDKIISSRINWDDPEILKRIVEERFLYHLESDYPRNWIWEKFFTLQVKGKSTFDYIYSCIEPRPRDIIFFCKEALSNAVNHKHPRIEEEDIILAETNYSNHAFSSLGVEINQHLDNAELLLTEFAGVNEIVTKNEVFSIFKSVNIPEKLYDQTIEILIEYAFLGIEIKPNVFVFLYERSKRKVFAKLSAKVSEEMGIVRFKINRPYHDYLSIKKIETCS